MKGKILFGIVIVLLGATVWIYISDINASYKTISQTESVEKVVRDIITNNKFDYKTYSLFKVGDIVLRINHDSGKTHYFNQGVWVPIQEFETLQKMALERHQFEQKMLKEAKERELLNKFD